MANVGIVITDSALNDFCRFFGLKLGEAARSELEREFQGAHFVKTRESGAEVWRGKRPRRIEFICAPQADGRLVLVKISPPFREAVANPQPREVRLSSDGGPVTFVAVDMIYEPGFQRRVAYKTDAGTWMSGRRGSRLDEVVGGMMESEDPPDWVLPYLRA